MSGRRTAATPVLEWLLEGDPAIRWQVRRDLLDDSPERVRRERAKVAREGWGARLLQRQNADGNWGRGPYMPKWTCTTYTMQVLRDLGLPPGNPAALRACRVYLEEGIGPDGGINFWRPRRRIGEACVSGMILSQLCAFGAADDRTERIVDYLLREQMPDGGWNCRKPQGARHSSFHTTISVLEGLREYASVRGGRSARTIEAETRGREFFLQHRLFRSSTTGAVVAGDMTRFHFPPRWHHDVLRTLDYFRAASAPSDPRLEESVELVRSRVQEDGRVLLAPGYRGAVFFEMERAGAPSRWNTLRAMRVLEWSARAQTSRLTDGGTGDHPET